MADRKNMIIGRKIVYLIVSAMLVIAIGTLFVMKNLFGERRKPYHDTVLVENVICGQQWQEFNVRRLIKFERDGQLMSIKFREPFKIDLDGDGGLIWPSGQPVDPEIQLVDANGNIYQNSFTGARGNKIATYSPEARTAMEESYETLRIRCDPPIDIEKIMWTTYSLKDRR